MNNEQVKQIAQRNGTWEARRQTALAQGNAAYVQETRRVVAQMLQQDGFPAGAVIVEEDGEITVRLTGLTMSDLSAVLDLACELDINMGG